MFLDDVDKHAFDHIVSTNIPASTRPDTIEFEVSECRHSICRCFAQSNSNGSATDEKYSNIVTSSSINELIMLVRCEGVACA